MVIIGNKNIKEIKGTVVSAKMDKTIVVAVRAVRLHPLYKKRFVKVKKYYAHDDANKAKEGDIVVIRQARPMSKKKRRALVNIEKKSTQVDA